MLTKPEESKSTDSKLYILVNINDEEWTHCDESRVKMLLKFSDSVLLMLPHNCEELFFFHSITLS